MSGAIVGELPVWAYDSIGNVVAARNVSKANPEITAFLQQFGRSGVPLYLLYDRAGAPTVLPQILTEGQLLAAIGKI